MSEVVVVGSFKARPGKEQEGLAAFQALVEPLGSPHVKAILERADELFGDSGDITVFEAVPGGEPKKGSLAEHAASA